MSRFNAAISYYLTARHKYGHGIHSPFVYRFVREILRDNTKYPGYVPIENLRHELIKDSRTISRMDYGAGTETRRELSLGEVVKKSAVRPKYGRLLYRISRYKKPARILELGTSLGISTLYLACGFPGASVVSLEGDPGLSNYAREHVGMLCPDDVRIVTGRFSDTLDTVVDEQKPFDLVYIDGDHRSSALLEYLHRIVPALSRNAWVIIDDIHWSEDMESGWKQATEIEGVTLSVDLLQMGLLFFEPRLSKQNIRIRF